MEDVKWRLNLEMASSAFAKSKEPNAMFELGVRDDTSQVSTGNHLLDVKLLLTVIQHTRLQVPLLED